MGIKEKEGSSLTHSGLLILLHWALEHKNVLRVLRLQTLEINSVVKDPTYLDPSLVTEVKYSSLTIIHHIY